MTTTNPFGVARAIGSAMIILPAGYLVGDISGLCYALIGLGVLLVLDNLD
jgi:hypothetical protein